MEHQLSCNAAGILAQIGTILQSPSSLTQFISYHERGNLIATWAFACRYRLEPVLKQVEAKIQARPLQTLEGLEDYAGSLPASAADLGISSTMRMLQTTTRNWSQLARAVKARCERVAMTHVGRCGALDFSELKSLVLQPLEEIIREYGPKQYTVGFMWAHPPICIPCIQGTRTMYTYIFICGCGLKSSFFNVCFHVGSSCETLGNADAELWEKWCLLGACLPR